MKHQLMLFKMLNPEAQILQCPGGNWRLVDRRRIGREELSKVRISLYKKSQREWCMLRAASPREWVFRQGAAKQGTTWCPSSPKDLPMYMTKAPPVPGEFLQRHRACLQSWVNTQAPNQCSILTCHSSTASRAPSRRLRMSWGCEGNHAMMAVQTFSSHRRGKIQQMAMFAYCYPHLPQKTKGYFNCETEGRRGN